MKLLHQVRGNQTTECRVTERSFFSTAILIAVLIFDAGLSASHAQSPFGRGRPAPPDHYVLIHAGTLLAVPGKNPQSQVTVVVKNDKVVEIVAGYGKSIDGVEARHIEIIDLSERFVLPGFMDAHVHLSGQPSFSRGRAQRGTWQGTDPAKAAMNAVEYSRRTLAAGFTTVRDVGSDDQSVFAVRNAINAGRMIGPRILASGSSLAVSGGHGDGAAIEATGDPAERLAQGVCDGADECRRAVRYQFKVGADLIKFTSTGGFGSNTSLTRQLYPDEIEAIVATAHMLGMKATTHAYTAEAMKDAVRAGVDSIEHGFLPDDETIQLMKKAGTYLVPTLSASLPPPIFNIKDSESERIRAEGQAFERAYAAGVNIAFGTDAGTFTHGTNAKEFDMMIKFGMSEMDALYVATLSTAALFGIEAEAGSIESGKLADIIAVDGNPLDDISVLHTIDFVMKSGRVAKINGRMTEPFKYPVAFP